MDIPAKSLNSQADRPGLSAIILRRNNPRQKFAPCQKVPAEKSFPQLGHFGSVFTVTFLSFPAGNGKGRQSRPYKSFTIVVTCNCHNKICDTFSSLFLIFKRGGVTTALGHRVTKCHKCHKLVPLIPCQNAVKSSTLVNEFRPAV